MLVPRPGVSPSGQSLPGRRHLPRLPASLGFALGFVAGVVVTILACLLGAGREPAVGFVLLAATAAAVGALTTPIGALSSATQCWALYTGFVLNRFGVLTFDHRSLIALAVMALAGILGSEIVTMRRASRSAAFVTPAPICW